MVFRRVELTLLDGRRHPLGATGGRLLSSLIYELRRTDKKVGVATLCMGTGAGSESHLLVRVVSLEC